MWVIVTSLMHRAQGTNACLIGEIVLPQEHKILGSYWEKKKKENAR